MAIAGVHVTAIAVLALGIGLNLAAFQVIDSVALSWLPIRSPETLVKLYRRSPAEHQHLVLLSGIRLLSAHGVALGAMATVSGAVTVGDDDARTIDAQFVTPNYFSELGAVPLAGRLLDPSDEGANADAVIVLSERLWRSRFGGEPSMIGRPLQVNGQPFTVVGVAADTFVGPGGRSGRHGSRSVSIETLFLAARCSTTGTRYRRLLRSRARRAGNGGGRSGAEGSVAGTSDAAS